MTYEGVTMVMKTYVTRGGQNIGTSQSFAISNTITLIHVLVKRAPNSAFLIVVLFSSLHTQGLIASFSVLVPWV